MNKEEKIPYYVENKERDTFTIYVKGTKPYLELQQENKQLKENWNKLKDYCKTHYYGITTIGILEIMKELEKGGSNEKQLL